MVMGTNSPIIRFYNVNTVQCYVCSIPSHQHTGPVTSIKYTKIILCVMSIQLFVLLIMMY